MEQQILDIIRELFGTTKMWDGTRTGFRHTLPMSLNNWDELKNKLKAEIPEYKRWPAKYTANVTGDFGMRFKEIKFTRILEDIFGGSWYFDDIDLVQGDTTIVSIAKDMTFDYMIACVESTPNIRK